MNAEPAFVRAFGVAMAEPTLEQLYESARDLLDEKAVAWLESYVKHGPSIAAEQELRAADKLTRKLERKMKKAGLTWK